MNRLLGVLLAIALLPGPVWGQDSVSFVLPEKLTGPAAYGVNQLIRTVSARAERVTTVTSLDRARASHVFVAGLATCEPVAKLVAQRGLEVPERPESLAIGVFRDEGRRVVVLCGRDATGLMYAALDTADRIGWATKDEDLFAHVRETVESPFLTDRSISTYTMQRRWFEQRLYDEDYWKSYFDLLAASRINSFVIIFGYENGGFMAPPYPYFFDVEGFPEVRLYGMTPEQQAKNTAALRRVIQLAHQRGIRITLGIWDHIYRGRVQSGGIPGADKLIGKKAPHLVYGLTAENLVPYTKAALKKLLATFPEVDAIQFRMHWESGLTRKETPRFWHEVFATLRQLHPKIRFDLRAKGLPDEVIEDAVAQRLPFRIATKYWMEQMGMPFHPTHVNPKNQHDRRHGYADLLRYPKRYDIHWRMWSGGTARFLLWGSPEYVRLFVRSARVYDGRSFEVNEMLATKMLGSPHDEKPFSLLNPPYRYYRYEFERYWHYYQVWGRVSYDPNVSSEVWEREFVRRFGAEAGPIVMRALHTASWILPRIVAAAYNYRYFPTTRGWAEMMRFGDLPEYAKGTGTDVEQFQSYQDAASQLLAGEFTALRSPFQTARWFSETAEKVLADVQAAQSAVGHLTGNAAREFRVTLTDLRILAYLARYHAARMRAAVWYNVYLKTKDRFAHQQCVQLESQAVEAWRKIVESAGDVYPENLQFGVQRVGFPRHWKEELQKMEAGLKRLKELPTQETLDAETRQRLLEHQRRMSTKPSLQIDVQRAKSARPGQDLPIWAEVKSDQQIDSVRLRYRHLTQFEDYRTVDMTLDPTSGRYVGVIPGSFIVPEWDLMYFVEVLPKNGPGLKAPDLDREMPYVIVPVERKDETSK